MKPDFRFMQLASDCNSIVVKALVFISYRHGLQENHHPNVTVIPNFRQS
jgi:hypothetical protein